MIYFDHNATTPISSEVRAVMEPFLGPEFGNPSSVHAPGRRARRAIEEARAEIAALLGAAEPDEIVFTSGGTEADAMAVGAIRTASRRSIAITAVEHPAVREPARALEREGFSLSELPVGPDGGLDVGAAASILAGQPGLVSVMAANNEYGGILDVARVASLAREKGCLVHSDAVCALGKIPVDVRTLGVDLMSVSAHKIRGPKGVGALYVRRGCEVPPLFPGGGQERRRRGGTENVAGIVGFGEAARRCRAEGATLADSVREIRDRFELGLGGISPRPRVWGAGAARAPNTSAVCFPGRSGEALLIRLDLAGIAVSVGSACSSGSIEPSPSILALGASREEARSTVRFSFGAGNTGEEVDRVLEILATA